MFPTVAHLCRSLPADLRPIPGHPVPEGEISAVHVSDLADPTPFLSGGELLLTTGLSIPDTDVGVSRYVGRIVGSGVVALGLGLGPHLHEVPDTLAEACRRAGLCLLVVPPASAFLTVSKQYWQARHQSSHRELTDVLTAQSRLVSAMLSPDPTSATLRSLSASTSTWTALLDDDAEVLQVFPAGRAHDAVEVGRRLKETGGAGLANVVTIPVRDEIVALFPLAVSETVRGHLALGSENEIGAIAHRLAPMAAALLSIDSVHRHRADAAVLAERRAITALVDVGQVDTARRLAQLLGLLTPPDPARVVQLRTQHDADVLDAVLRWSPEAYPGPRDLHASTGVRELWFLVPPAKRDLDSLRARLARVDPSASAAVSDVTALALAHQVRIGLAERTAALPPATFLGAARGRYQQHTWAAGLDALDAYPRADLIGALTAYLRHRGQWDAAARDLGVHRNTLRNRMEKVRSRIGCDIDDPDVASEIWLHLRAVGRA